MTHIHFIDESSIYLIIQYFSTFHRAVKLSMLKRLKKNRHVSEEMLKEGLLTEGGGALNPASLAALDADYAAGDTGADPAAGRRSKSKASDETRIEGLE